MSEPAMQIVAQESLSDSWETPEEVFQYASEKWGPFDLDAAASHENGKCEEYYTVDGGFLRGLKVDRATGLEAKWHQWKSVWLNPPYSNPYPWVQKAVQEARKGCRVVMLLNADHTALWYKEFIEDTRTWPHAPYPGVTVRRYPKRIRFKAPKGLISRRTGKPVKSTTNPFPSILVVFEPAP